MSQIFRLFETNLQNTKIHIMPIVKTTHLIDYMKTQINRM